MPKKIKMFITGLFLALVGVACVALFAGRARAEEADYAQSGDGWSISADGVMKIESDQGWVNCLKVGFKDTVWKLIIGKNVTNFRMYSLPEDVPCEDFFGSEDIISYSVSGKPIYDFEEIISLYPSKIVVEEGNSVFRVNEGLLINTVTNELVLSEMGVSDVVIPEGIKTITKGAFRKRPLISIQLPSSLTSIGVYAFSKCDELKSINLPDSVSTLGAFAFSMCSSLENVILSKNLQVIEQYTFDKCGIQYVEIPGNIEEIGRWAFYKCKQLKQVKLTAGIHTIARSAFCDCHNLQSINFPEGITSIGEAAFGDCYELNSVYLPDSLQQIGQDVFSGCKISVFRIPEKLDFTVFYFNRGYIVNPHKKTDKSFDLSSVDTVILSGSDYDFGYPAITDAKNVYFLGKPPEDIGQILDENSVESIYCSDEFEFEWTRSTVASWVRQRLTILPAEQIKDFAETAINTTPEPTNTPRPTLTPKPTETPWPTPMPRPTATPITEVSEQKPADPILFVFAGVLALVVAGIAAVAVKSRKSKRHPQKKGK